MSALDRVVREVVDEALAEYRNRLKEAGEEAVRMLDSLEAETLLEAQAAHEAGKRQRETQRQRLLSLAEISAKNKSISVIEDGVNRVLEQAARRVAEMSAGKGLEDDLKTLLLEAVEAVGVKDVVAESSQLGLTVLAKIAKEVEAERMVKISADSKLIETVGGVRVRSVDGRIIYDNTVEARLERLRPLLRREIARLFSAGSK